MEHAQTFQRHALKGDVNAQLACYGIGNYFTLKTFSFCLAFKGVGRKISRGEGKTEKTSPKNSTIKPPSTLSVSCMKIQGGHARNNDKNLSLKNRLFLLDFLLSVVDASHK